MPKQKTTRRSPKQSHRSPRQPAAAKKSPSKSGVRHGRAAVMPKGRRSQPASRRWTRRVMERSDALDLDKGVFKLAPAKMAASLKRSAERSNRRKAKPFQSAMSMLNFYANRGGKNLPAGRKRALEQAKGELRKLYGRK